jgi:hypothetical protein
MTFELPKNALSRLARMISNATDTNGSAPLVAKLVIEHQGGEVPSDSELAELSAVLAGYDADPGIDETVDKESEL